VDADHSTGNNCDFIEWTCHNNIRRAIMHKITLDEVSLTPSKIVCIGRNYAAHIEELGNEVPDDMVVFCKPNSAISQTLYSHHGEPLHYESELAFVVIGGDLRGVGFGLDLTKRGLQAELKIKGLPWERAKSFDGSALFGPFTIFPENIEELSLSLTINGDLRQAGGVELMMYKPPLIMSELKKFMSLEDGDIIMTGTPAGVGQVRPGENFEGRVLAGDKVLSTVHWVAQ
jgi:2-keto-4-pentenoate hydratase/2-oxohepta-3-ene-1,7-dioic acid hydratase in catechol pathway